MDRISELSCEDKPSMHDKVVEFTVHEYVDSYANPMQTLCKPYANPMQTLCKPYVDPMPVILLIFSENNSCQM
jgi:hypothetical protein